MRFGRKQVRPGPSSGLVCGVEAPHSQIHRRWGGGFRRGICLVPGTVSTDGAGGANNGYSLGLGSVEGHLFYT